MTAEPRRDVPQWAQGVDLIGQWEGSGYVEPRYLVKRGDGSVVQLHALVYRVVEAVDGRRSYAEVAREVSTAAGRTLTAENVKRIADTKLRPLGVLAEEDGSSPDVTPLDPLLALTARTGVVPERVVNAVTTVFRPLFFWPVVVLAAVGVIALDYWLVLHHGVGQGLRSALYQPVTTLIIIGLIVLSAALHEVGHATACAYSGARPGKMGAGLYLAWPAFYTDVTDAYRLSRRGRLRVDFGGIYFTALLVLLLAAGNAAFGFAPLLMICFLLQLEIFRQLLPFLRLDGYYVVSDLVGVPDLFARIGPILRSAVPGKPTAPQVHELKPWARAVVTGWVLLVVPVLLIDVSLLVVSLPRVVATAWDSAAGMLARFGPASGLGKAVLVLQLVLLALPLVAMSLAFVHVGRQAVRALRRWAHGSRRRKAVAAAVGLLAAAVAVVVLWPDQDYRPYGPHERGTLPEGIRSVAQVGVGHPHFADPFRKAPPPPPASGPAPGAGAAGAADGSGGDSGVSGGTGSAGSVDGVTVPGSGAFGTLIGLLPLPRPAAAPLVSDPTGLLPVPTGLLGGTGGVPGGVTDLPAPLPQPGGGTPKLPSPVPTALPSGGVPSPVPSASVAPTATPLPGHGGSSPTPSVPPSGAPGP